MKIGMTNSKLPEVGKRYKLRSSIEEIEVLYVNEDCVLFKKINWGNWEKINLLSTYGLYSSYKDFAEFFDDFEELPNQEQKSFESCDHLELEGNGICTKCGKYGFVADISKTELTRKGFAGQPGYDSFGRKLPSRCFRCKKEIPSYLFYCISDCEEPEDKPKSIWKDVSELPDNNCDILIEVEGEIELQPFSVRYGFANKENTKKYCKLTDFINSFKQLQNKIEKMER